MCSQLFIRHVIGDCIDFPRMAIRVECPNLILTGVTADGVIFIHRGKACIRETLAGNKDIRWGLHQNPEVVQRPVCERLSRLIEREFDRRGCDIEVGIPRPNLVRLLAKEGCIEAGASFYVLNIK
jgi:hypothetical protein